MVEIIEIKDYANLCSSISDTDRWIFGICSGDMGEGKSRFTSALLKEISKLTNKSFNYNDNMTYSRKELKEWIDGDKEGKKQKEERSCILADELISMFFKRNWYDSEQIDGIELLNKCRDRHLIVFGNVPDLLELDSSLLKIATFWVHIYERGRAWVSQRDRNPYVVDKWHISENAKIFNKDGNPYRCKGFICEVRFTDYEEEDKQEYYRVRNLKRRNTEGQRHKEERYGLIKEQRDKLIQLVFKYNKKLTNKDIADTLDLSKEAVRLIRSGLR